MALEMSTLTWQQGVSQSVEIENYIEQRTSIDVSFLANCVAARP